MFAPLEATAPLWLLVGLAAAGPAYDRAMAVDRERRLDELERWLTSQLRELDVSDGDFGRIAASEQREQGVA